MPSFTLNALSTTARTLNPGETGLVDVEGVLLRPGGSAPVTMNGAADLENLGGIVSITDDAVRVTGQGGEIENGGTIRGGDGASAAGIDYVGTAGDANLSIVNTGVIEGRSFSGAGIRLNSGGVTITNLGTIHGTNSAAIILQDFNGGSRGVSIVNSGTISTGVEASFGEADVIQIANNDPDRIENTGQILGNILTGGGNDVVVNDGVISGGVFTGDGDDLVISTGRIGSLTDADFVIDCVVLGAGNDTLDARGADGLMAVVGGPGDDLCLVSTSGAQLFEGVGGGNDRVETTADIRITGQEIETVIMTGGAVMGIGSDTANTFLGSNLANFLDGAGGNDTIHGREGNDTILGGEGDDDLTGGTQNDSLQGGAGNDSLFGSDHDDSLFGGIGNDLLHGGTENDLLNGDEGNDILFGDGGADQLFGGIGDDSLTGGTENDRLFGETGNDTLSGEQGDDFIGGLLGNDSLLGGAGNDSLFGEQGDDISQGEAGNDVIRSFTGNDTLFGGDGFDFLDGADNDDFIGGGNDNDTLLGGAGNDRLFGEFGDDSQSGDAGDDVLRALTGNDTLDGGTGNDILDGGAGVDRLTGGIGADRFDFVSLGDSGVTAATRDVITDFQSGVDDLFLTGLGLSVAPRPGGGIGGDFTGVAGQLIFRTAGGNGFVEVDANGDRAADFSVQLTGVTALAVTDLLL